jgi:hypothetical protein
MPGAGGWQRFTKRFALTKILRSHYHLLAHWSCTYDLRFSMGNACTHEATAAALIAERQKLWPTSDCASTSGHSALRVIHGLSTNFNEFFLADALPLAGTLVLSKRSQIQREQHQHAQSRRCRTHCREAEAPAHLFDADCGSHTTPSGPHSAYVRCEGSHTYFLAIALPLLCKPALRIRPQIQHG